MKRPFGLKLTCTRHLLLVRLKQRRQCRQSRQGWASSISLAPPFGLKADLHHLLLVPGHAASRLRRAALAQERPEVCARTHTHTPRRERKTKRGHSAHPLSSRKGAGCAAREGVSLLFWRGSLFWRERSSLCCPGCATPVRVLFVVQAGLTEREIVRPGDQPGGRKGAKRCGGQGTTFSLLVLAYQHIHPSQGKTQLLAYWCWPISACTPCRARHNLSLLLACQRKCPSVRGAVYKCSQRMGR